MASALTLLSWLQDRAGRGGCKGQLQEDGLQLHLATAYESPVRAAGPMPHTEM